MPPPHAPLANPKSDFISGDTKRHKHTTWVHRFNQTGSHKQNQTLVGCVETELAGVWWHPDLKTEPPCHVLAALKNTMHIKTPLINIHQRHALLAAGPRPVESRSFVWHGCRCLEHEIKLVAVIWECINASLFTACVCVSFPVSGWMWLSEQTSTATFPQRLWHVDFYSWQVEWLQVRDKQNKSFACSFDTNDRWVGKRKVEGMMNQEGWVRWRQLCFGVCNWVLIELALKVDEWIVWWRKTKFERIGPHLFVCT